MGPNRENIVLDEYGQWDYVV